MATRPAKTVLTPEGDSEKDFCQGQKSVSSVIRSSDEGSVLDARGERKRLLKIGSKSRKCACSIESDNFNADASVDSGAKLVSCSFVKKGSVSASPYHRATVEVMLEGKSLWDEFYCRGTEMIVNRAGRRMFPGFSVAISALKPKLKYSMKLDIVLADNHRFKFLNSKWLAVGSAEPQPASESYLHPDSPNSGAFWMRHGVSFRKLKITNNKERPGNNALLYSMHKYFLRFVVEEECKAAVDDIASKVVLSRSFPETTFVAVTAYQNEEVTQLKITNNPFAKAFRENAADMDWESVQIICDTQSSIKQTDHGGQFIPHGTWPFSNPVLPSPFFANSLPPFSPFSGLAVSNSSDASSFAAHYSPYSCNTGHCFQWPVYPTGHNLHQPLHGEPQQNATLPDFETVFTPLSN